MFRSWKFGAALATGCLALLLVLGAVRPFGVLEHEAPMTTARRATAGFMLLLNLLMYLGVAIVAVAGIRRFTTRT